MKFESLKTDKQNFLKSAARKRKQTQIRPCWIFLLTREVDHKRPFMVYLLWKSFQIFVKGSRVRNERRNERKLILFLLYNFRALERIGAAYRSMKSLCWNFLKNWANHFSTQIWDLFPFFVLVTKCWFDTSNPWVATCFWFFSLVDDVAYCCGLTNNQITWTWRWCGSDLFMWWWWSKM